MKTLFIVIGKTVDQHLELLIQEYVKRISHYITFEIEVIPDLKNTKNLSFEQQKKREGELLLKVLRPTDTLVLLDEHGKEFRSVEFARYMTNKLSNTSRRLVFVIGGAYGFDQKIYDLAHEKISLSKMTFSHQMIRLLFVEQLYRAMTIIKGEPYHHE